MIEMSCTRKTMARKTWNLLAKRCETKNNLCTDYEQNFHFNTEILQIPKCMRCFKSNGAFLEYSPKDCNFTN